MQGMELTKRTPSFPLRLSLSSDQPGSLPSSSPVHQPGSERQLSNSLGHRPAGCAPGQRLLPGPDCEPSADVSEGADGEFPAQPWLRRARGTGRAFENWGSRKGRGLEKGREEALGDTWQERRVE